MAAPRTALSRIGNSINQIAHTYDAGGPPRSGDSRTPSLVSTTTPTLW
ncbi:MobC domain-containing protein [Streptomyces niveiscabiei]|uniref:Bacterial mobilisation domain-containing protein n=1 Tax=Streptomyces niveiscabiei TaxID=164115 RepID=A0ABW9HP56_9ACTN